MRKQLKRTASLFLVFILTLSSALSLMPPIQAHAANATKDNAVIFRITGKMESGKLKFNVIIDEVFDQKYQSINILYPKELKINVPDSVKSNWIFSEPTPAAGSSSKTAGFIVRGVARTAAQLKTDLQAISFELADDDVMLPDKAKVSIQARATKETSWTDDNLYVHYYKYVPFSEVGSKDWLAAYNYAQTQTRQDPRFPDDPTKTMKGYLATITCEAEQIQLYSQIATACGWLGGTRMLITKNDPQGKSAGKIQEVLSPNTSGEEIDPTVRKISTTIGDYDTATGTAKEWYWACGPESLYFNPKTDVDDATGATELHNKTPLVFMTTPTFAASTDSRVPKVYQNFNNTWKDSANNQGSTVHIFDDNKNLVGTAAGTGGEPNNSGTEYCLQFAYTTATYNVTKDGKTYTNDKPDTWNDYAYGNMNKMYGFYIEWGGYPPDPKDFELMGAGMESTCEIEIQQPVLVQYRSTVTTDTTETTTDHAGKPVTNTVAVNNTISALSAADKTDGKAYDYKILDSKSSTYKADRMQSAVAGAAALDAIPGYTSYGYRFIGDAADEEKLSQNINGDVSGYYSNAVQKIVFLFKPNTYKVTFDANFPGANAASSTPSVKDVLYDNPYGTLATTAYPGNTFLGWFTDPSAGTEVTAATKVTELRDHTLYAHWTQTTNLKVTYALNDTPSAPASPVSIADKENVKWADHDLLPAAPPTRSGYIFAGWDVSDNGTKQNVSAYDTYGGLTTDPAATFITLQAQWVKDQTNPSIYTVIYHTNGANAPEKIANAELKTAADKVTLPTITKKGYSFNGWKVTNKGDDSTGSTYNALTNNTFAQLAAANAQFIIVEAQWSPKLYTVVYDRNDGGDTKTTPASFANVTNVLWTDKGFVPPTEGNPTRDGYTFLGWNTKADSSGISAATGSTYAQLSEDHDSASSLTLYAQWAEKMRYHVRYDLNGATAPASLDDKTGLFADDKNLLPATDPTRTGYNFAGWKVSYNGAKTGVTNNDKFNELAANTSLSYIVLQAQWSPKSGLTVKYNLNGGSASSTGNADLYNDRSAGWSESNLIPGVDPAKTGSIFSSWNTRADGTGLTVNNKSTFAQMAGYADVSVVTLYAQWGDASKYIVTYLPGIGSLDRVSEELAAETDKVSAITPTAPAGYEFKKWILANNGNGTGNPNKVATNATTFKELAYPGAHRIELAADYEIKNDYQVIYNVNYSGGTNETVTNVKWSEKGFVPHVARRAGYSLLGWTMDAEGKTAYVAPENTYAALAGTEKSSITLYAQWHKASYTVSYDLNGAIVPVGSTDYIQKTVGWDDDHLLPKQPTRAGFEFLGWNVSKNGSKTNVSATDSFSALVNNGEVLIELQAQWKEYVVTITYKVEGDGAITRNTETIKQGTGTPTGSCVTTTGSTSHFVCWKDPDGNVVGTDLNFIPKKENGLNVPGPYTAVFEKNEASYKVEHYLVNASTSTAALKDTETISAVTKDGKEVKVRVDDTATAIAKTTYLGYVVNPAHANAVPTGRVLEDGSLTLKLYYEEGSAHITYTPGGGGTVTVPSEDPKTHTGTPTGSTAEPDEDYDFVGWGDPDGNIVTTDYTLIPPKGPDGVYVPITYTAKFKKKIIASIYTVEHYVVDGSGTATLKKDDAIPAVVDDSVTAAPTTFTGYTYAPGHSGEVKTGIVTKERNGKLTLRLYYTANVHNITYKYENAPNGSLTQYPLPAASTGAYDSIQTIAAAPRAGDTFEIRIPGETKTEIIPEELDTDGVTVLTPEQTITTTEPDKVTTYVFLGWESSVTRNAVDTFRMPNADVTLTGKWAALDDTTEYIAYKIEHNFIVVDFGTKQVTVTLHETEIRYGKKGDTVTAQPLDYDGYNFRRSYTDNVLIGSLDNDSLVLKLHYSSVKKAERVALIQNPDARPPMTMAADLDVDHIYRYFKKISEYSQQNIAVGKEHDVDAALTERIIGYMDDESIPSDVEVDLVATKWEESTQQAQEIKAFAAIDDPTRKFALFEDLSLYLEVEANVNGSKITITKHQMHSSGDYIHITVDLAGVYPAGAKDFKVYREHEDLHGNKSVTALPMFDPYNPDQECVISIDSDEAVLQVENFSVYAFSYKDGTAKTPSGNTDGNTGNNNGNTGNHNGNTGNNNGNTGNNNGNTGNRNGNTGNNNGNTDTSAYNNVNGYNIPIHFALLKTDSRDTAPQTGARNIPIMPVVLLTSAIIAALLVRRLRKKSL